MNRGRPLLFSPPMVRAILDGVKTQTRRLAKDYERGAAWARQPCAAGDDLWVRETWCKNTDGSYRYLADYRDRDDVIDGLAAHEIRWRPSIFMPRAASRIALRATEVRAERLQNINTRDALAEGWMFGLEQPPIQWYRTLWDTLNARSGYTWTSNPVVWVISFERPLQ